jgi:orotidine-5'-phosphate decarboxylase
MIPIFLPIDVPDFHAACKMVALAGEDVDLKFGLTFIAQNDITGCNKLARVTQNTRKRLVFLDRKYWDIPRQVAGAIRADMERCEPDFITLNTADGPEPLRAAVLAVNELAALGVPRPKLLGVTVLTSVNDAEQLRLIPKRADDARDAGLDGLVCAVENIAMHRQMWPQAFLMTPGISMTGKPRDDQKRVGTARMAEDLGADAVVIGRDITTAADPAQMVRDIRATMK